ncbi:MAG: threonylcarbamoyl-AMP synthase [Bacteroidetes bacterium QS_8_68_15]|nr:MAG: threonylcarbamoyl-AMP synthase [Bacteroidetes bacterium QS_8_68_15]
MQTRLTRSTDEAAAALRDGERVVFPTETVYGLGADAFDAEAVRGVFEAKGRPADNPLIVHVAAREHITQVARTVPPAAERLVERFFPGVRMPRLPVAQRFLAACATPVAAPSANRSGRPSPTTWQAARDDLGGRVEAILRGPPTEAGLESTVVDCTIDPLGVLRAGATTLEALRAALPDATIRPPVGAEDASEGSEHAARSPGTRHRHYAPDARVVVVNEPPPPPPSADAGRRAYIGLTAPAGEGAFARVEVCENVEAYARALFAFFRAADTAGCDVICAQAVADTGLGRALMDRLRRASVS